MLISIKDNMGRTVYSTKLNVQKASNSTTLSKLSRFSSAVYNIVMQMEEDNTSKKTNHSALIFNTKVRF